MVRISYDVFITKLTVHSLKEHVIEMLYFKLLKSVVEYLLEDDHRSLGCTYVSKILCFKGLDNDHHSRVS